MSTPEDIAKHSLHRAGTTCADDAGITLKDAQKPLFQLLVLCMLASKPIDADIAEPIFLREVQAVWPWVRPYFDDRARVPAPRSTAELAAAPVRASLDEELRTALAS